MTTPVPLISKLYGFSLPSSLVIVTVDGHDEAGHLRGGVVELDEERKAAMVSNLLVVLCGEEHAQPVLNTGSLYT